MPLSPEDIALLNNVAGLPGQAPQVPVDPLTGLPLDQAVPPPVAPVPPPVDPLLGAAPPPADPLLTPDAISGGVSPLPVDVPPPLPVADPITERAPVFPEDRPAGVIPRIEQSTDVALEGVQDQYEAAEDMQGSLATAGSIDADIILAKNEAEQQLAQKNLEKVEQGQKRFQEIRAAQDEARSKLEADSAETSLFDNMSTGQKFAGFIGALASGLFQVRRGGPNTFMQSFHRMVQQNIDRQRVAYDRKLKALKDKFGLQFDQEEVDRKKDMAQLALEQAHINKAVSQLEAARQKATTQVELDRIDILLGELKEKGGLLMRDSDKLILAAVGKEQSRGFGAPKQPVASVDDPVVYVAGQGYTNMSKLSDKQQGMAVGGVTFGTGKGLHRGAVLAKSTEDKKYLTDLVSSYTGVRQHIQRIKAFQDQAGGSGFNLSEFSSKKEAALIASELKQLYVTMNKQFGLGALAEADLEILEKAAGGDETSIKGFVSNLLGGKYSRDVLENLQEGAEVKLKSEIGNRAFVPDGVNLDLYKRDVTVDIKEKKAAEGASDVALPPEQLPSTVKSMYPDEFQGMLDPRTEEQYKAEEKKFAESRKSYYKDQVNQARAAHRSSTGKAQVATGGVGAPVGKVIRALKNAKQSEQDPKLKQYLDQEIKKLEKLEKQEILRQSEKQRQVKSPGVRRAGGALGL